ncbi:cation diffusion facilitator family transporter [Candidatus Gracilibacteria bacterium]|nr:cation diffusion facilitator family transporter [Candidatus Gracilibacteria bacterium]
MSKTKTQKSEPKLLSLQHAADLRRGTAVARNSLLLLVIMMVIKGGAGYLTNIVALVGDAIGSFSDIIAMTAIFIGLKLSQRHANRTFKYGYHRIETLATLIISLIVLTLGIRVFIQSYDRLLHPAATSSHIIGMISATLSIGISLFAFHYQKNIGKKINSQAMLASAYDKRNDAIVSAGVFVSVIADKYHILYVEGIIGMLVALLIIYTGLNHGKESLLYLLDYWDNPEITKQIQKILAQSPIITEVKNIRLRHAGTYIYGEVFVEVNAFVETKDLRDELHRLNREIQNNIEHLGDFVIYIDPPKPTTMRVALPIQKENGLSSLIATAPEKEFLFFIVEIKNGGIKKFYRTPEKFFMNDAAKIIKLLKKERINILISSLIHPLLYYQLRLNNIKVYPHFNDIKDVENTIKLLLLDV